MAQAKKNVTTRRRREKKNIERGCAHIQATFNNTIVTITDVIRYAIEKFSIEERKEFMGR